MMITLFSTLISFLTGGLPKLLDFFQDKSDKKHELQLAQMQLDQQMRMQSAGFQAQERVEAIHTEQLQIEANVQERQALYAHDIAIGQGASQWVINMRAIVRPAITFGLFGLLVFVDIFGFYYAIKTGVAFDAAMNILWDDETQIIWSSVVAFWFGTQAFAKK
jgi:hypothetical protein